MHLEQNALFAYQDGIQQKIVFTQYISSVQTKPGEERPKRLFDIPTPALKREAIQRTIVFLVDDICMSFRQAYWTRLYLHKFIEAQMQAELSQEMMIPHIIAHRRKAK
jgi:hypothetical protein